MNSSAKLSAAVLFFANVAQTLSTAASQETVANSLAEPPATKAVGTAVLLKTIPFEGFVANEIYPADLDGDGRFELLCLQSPGCYQSDVFSGTRSEVPIAQRQIFCLTAIDLEGKVLWQTGEPNLKFRQASSHVADQMIWFGNLDNSGKPEVALIRGSTLEIRDPLTGAVNRSADLKYDNFSIVRRVRARAGNRLLVQNTEKGYGFYEYSLPALLYDASTLKLITIISDIAGSGHSPRAVDLDGDGNEEVLLGYDAYSADGEHLWRVKDIGPVNPIKNHVDQLQVGKIGPNAAPRVVYAGSFNVVIASIEGNLLYKQSFGHPQHVILGNFKGDNQQACIAIYCCRDLLGGAQEKYLKRKGIPVPPKGSRNNIAFLNDEGEVVSVIFPPDLKYHSGEGILLYPQGCPDGSDAVITRDWEWPEAFDLAGGKPFLFPRPKSASSVPEHSPHGPGPDGYGVRIADFDGDGRAEVLIHDQTTAWIYKPPYPKPSTPHTHRRLEPITGQGLPSYPPINSSANP